MKAMRKKIILCIAGDIAAGKNEAASFIEKKYRGYAYRSSEVLRDILCRMYLPETRENMQKVSIMVREYFGDDIISYIASLDIKKIKNNIIAINGIRRFSDISHLKKNFRVKLIYIEADLAKRFKRINQRLENTDDKIKTFSEFEKDHKIETETRIKYLRRKADYIIENNGTLKEFHKKIDQITKSL